MKRIFAVAALILLYSGTMLAQEPDAKHGKFATAVLWIPQHWRPIAATVFVMGSSVAATHWSHECREKFGPAPCEGGYGAYSAREGVRGGMSLTMDLMSLYGRKKGYKEWLLPAGAWGVYNVYVAAHQAGIGCPTGEHFVYGTKFTCIENYPPGWGAQLVPEAFKNHAHAF